MGHRFFILSEGVPAEVEGSGQDLGKIRFPERSYAGDHSEPQLLLAGRLPILPEIEISSKRIPVQTRIADFSPMIHFQTKV
jgi:hypothetical protein